MITGSDTNALRELRRFFVLAVETGQKLPMPSRYIDRAWHTLMESAEDYNAFCAEVCGMYISHSTQSEPASDIAWVKAYEHKHGRLPLEWFMDEHGRVDSASVKHYERTGGLYACWDCNATSAGGKKGIVTAVTPQVSGKKKDGASVASKKPKRSGGGSKKK